MSDSKNTPDRTSDRIGFYCSAFLLSFLAVMVIFAIQGAIDPENGAFAVTGLILLIGPVLLFFASFVCGIVLHWFDCRLRYHLSWVLVLLVCLAVVVFIGLQANR